MAAEAFMAAVSRDHAASSRHEPYSTNTARSRGIYRTKGDKNRQDHHDVHRGYREDGDKDRQDHHDGHRSNGDDTDGRIDSIKGMSAVITGRSAVLHHDGHRSNGDNTDGRFDSLKSITRFLGPYDVPIAQPEKLSLRGSNRHTDNSDSNYTHRSRADNTDSRFGSIKGTTRFPGPYDVPITQPEKLSLGRVVRPANDSDSDDDEPIDYWIPGEGIDLTVLASYIQEYVDNISTIRQSRSPRDRDKTGFTISAQATISEEGLRDIIKDSKLWAAETKSREYRNDPYPYLESDTWIARKRTGPSPGHIKTRETRQRRRVVPTRPATVDASTSTDITHASRPSRILIIATPSSARLREDSGRLINGIALPQEDFQVPRTATPTRSSNLAEFTE